MKVPFFQLQRQIEALQPELDEALAQCIRSCSFIEGPAVKRLEASLCEYLNVKYAIACGNGTDALRIALRALGVAEGDEVITSPFTFFATAEAIATLGAVPVFTDIDPVTLNMDPALLEAAVTPRTRAIVPVDIFGVPADMDAINQIARRFGLRVVEDACQAIGASYHGRMASTLGDVGCFSFYPTKNLGAFGDGGMMVTNDEATATLCRALKTHGSGENGRKAAVQLGLEPPQSAATAVQAQEGSLNDPAKYYNYLIGENSRLDSLQAAVLQVKLTHLDAFNQKRAANARRYLNALQDTPLILPPMKPEGVTPCWHQYAVLAPDKPALCAALADADIGTGAFYPVPLHLQKAFRSLGYQPGSLPVAETACQQSVCLPIFPELTPQEADYVITTIRRHYGLA